MSRSPAFWRLAVTMLFAGAALVAADPVALADVLNALDPAHPVRVPCLAVLPITGPVGPVPSF